MVFPIGVGNVVGGFGTTGAFSELLETLGLCALGCIATNGHPANLAHSAKRPHMPVERCEAFKMMCCSLLEVAQYAQPRRLGGSGAGPVRAGIR